MKRISISEELYNKIINYCKLNKINDINKEISDLIVIGYNIKLYGEKPPMFQVTKTETPQIKEEPIIQEIIEPKKEETIDKIDIEQEKPKRKVRIIKN